ncbi:MAG: hypothetical protein CR977_00840 [Gammaproteobacteria bacterium]|nr:MAG: hypothetical protein CR977_00840 [Gammaproteobacteria bacterium]
MFINRFLLVAAFSAFALLIIAASAYRKSAKTAALLQQQNETLSAQVNTLQAQYALTKQAYKALSETQLQIQKKNHAVIKRIKAAPKGDDAPIAPVLKQALEAIE